MRTVSRIVTYSQQKREQKTMKNTETFASKFSELLLHPNDLTKYSKQVEVTLACRSDQRGGPVRRICYKCDRMLVNKAYEIGKCTRCETSINKNDCRKMVKHVWMQVDATIIGENNNEIVEARTETNFGLTLLKHWTNNKIKSTDEFDILYFGKETHDICEELYKTSIADQQTYKCTIEIFNVSNKDPAIVIYEAIN